MTNNTKNNITTTEDLLKYNLINIQNKTSLDKIAENFSIKINPYLTSTITKASSGIKQQFIPSIQELNNSDKELIDPISDDLYMPVKGLIHRYPDRCLLQPLQTCPIFCRFCFRKEKINNHNKILSEIELQQCYDYLSNNHDIWEVILTGGDPLMLNPIKLTKIFNNIKAINHIEVIRIHTRIPLMDPGRVNNKMLQALTSYKPIYIVLHANHPDEFTTQGINAIERLVDAGIPMLSQSVLLNGINDNLETLSKLMRNFIKHRIKPYYLHHGDLAKGTKHFRTTIAHGQKLIEQLRGRFSGLCQPTYVLDIPGGYGKSPLTPTYCKNQDCSKYLLKDYQGTWHNYQEDL